MLKFAGCIMKTFFFDFIFIYTVQRSSLGFIEGHKCIFTIPYRPYCYLIKLTIFRSTVFDYYLAHIINI